MTLEEAIKRCEEDAKEMRELPLKEEMDIEDIAAWEECAEEYEQLAKWLKELKEWREIGKTCVDKGICVPIIFNGNIVPDMLQGWKYEQKNST